MARLLGHRQTKGADTDKPTPTATASHSYSTEVTPSCRRSTPPGARSRAHIPQCNVEPVDDHRFHRGSVCHRGGAREIAVAVSPRFVVVSSADIHTELLG
jgi:hypothetical protein